MNVEKAKDILTQFKNDPESVDAEDVSNAINVLNKYTQRILIGKHKRPTKRTHAHIADLIDNVIKKYQEKENLEAQTKNLEAKREQMESERLKRENKQTEKELALGPTKIKDLLDKVIKKYQEKENEDATKKKTSESIMLAYVLVEKCVQSNNKSVNHYLRTDCMDRIGAYL